LLALIARQVGELRLVEEAQVAHGLGRSDRQDQAHEQLPVVAQERVLNAVEHLGAADGPDRGRKDDAAPGGAQVVGPERAQ